MTNPPDSGAENIDRLASGQIPAQPSDSSGAESQPTPATWQPPDSLPTWAAPVSEATSLPESTASPEPTAPPAVAGAGQPEVVTAAPAEPDSEPEPVSSDAPPAWSPPAQSVDPPAWGSSSTQQRSSIQPPSAAPAPYGQGNYGQGNYGQGNYGQGNYGQNTQQSNYGGNPSQSNYGQGNPGQGSYPQPGPGLGTPSQSAYVGFEPTGQHQPVAPSNYGQGQQGYGAPSPSYGNQSYGGQSYGGQVGNTPYGGYSGAAPAQVLPPAKKRSTKLIAGLISLVVVLAAVAVVLVVKPDLFRTPKVLDSSQVASDVSTQYEEQFQTQIKGFACDKSELVVQKGESYQCSATTDAGDPVNITITITDDQGAYTWKDDAQ